MYRPKNQWHIIFEGTDCSGKSTLLAEFNKATTFNHLLSDRGTISTRAYSKKFNRTENGDFLKIEENIASYPCHLLVYITANKEDVVKRQLEKNDGYDASDYDIDKKLFDEAVKESRYKHITFLNSSEMSIEKEIEIILSFIETQELLMIDKE